MDYTLETTKIFRFDFFFFWWGGTLIGRGNLVMLLDRWSGSAPMMENLDQDFPTIIYRSK